MRRSTILLSCLSILSISSFTSKQQAYGYTILEHMNLATMTETSTTSLAILNEMTGGGTGPNVSWNATFSESGWTYSGNGFMNGKIIQIDYTGALSGTYGNTITVNFTGAGFLGTTPINIEGQTQWLYDIGSSSYQDMLYDDQIHLGSGSWWGVVRGAELLGGGGVGGYFGGWYGALAGATTAWTISDIAKEVVEGVTPPTPPVRPPAPSIPPNQPPSPPSSPNIEVYTFNNPSGNININKNLGGRTITTGEITGNTSIGSTAPEPDTMLLVGTGLILLAGARRKMLA